MQEKTLIIVSKASKSFAPDIIVISLSHSKVFLRYEDALKEVATRTKEIQGKVIEAGLEASSVKTTDFSVDPDYESYKDKDGNYKKRFVGYRNKARFDIALPFDNALLSKLLGTLVSLEDTISFSYRLSKVEEAQDEVMQLAVKAAIRKARLIAEASAINLGEIQKIDYSVEEIDVHYRNHMLMADCCTAKAAGAIDVEIAPEDLTLSDQVNVVFGIN